MAVIREANKADKPVLPASNLELDLGFDSMERVELVVVLEREMGAQLDEKVIAQVYTVRELVEGILLPAGRCTFASRLYTRLGRSIGGRPGRSAGLAALNSSRLFSVCLVLRWPRCCADRARVFWPARQRKRKAAQTRPVHSFSRPSELSGWACGRQPDSMAAVQKHVLCWDQ